MQQQVNSSMKELSDKELVEAMLINDEQVIRYFFFERCTPMFVHIIRNIFDYRVKKEELINELYIYLQENEWYKLRHFDYRSKLTTWLSVVAIRFFQKMRSELIENEPVPPLYKEKTEDIEKQIHRKLDVESLINRLPNERYRLVIQKLMLEDKEPQEVADEMKITVDNLYNIKRRAIQQLIQIYRKEGGNGK